MEHLFAKGVDKAVQFVHGKRMEAWKGGGEPFVLEGNRKRFAALASMIAGREFEVASIRGDTPPRPYWPVIYRMAHPALLPEHGFGWSDGETLFFPVTVVEMPDEASREELTKALLFFLAFQARGETLEVARLNRGLLEADRLVADLFWIIENQRLHGQIASEYPGVIRSWGGFTRYLLDRRPPARYLNQPEKKVEEFLRETLGQAFSGHARTASASAGESLSAAAELKGRWVSEGLKTGKYRGMVPFFPWGKLIAGRIKGAVPGRPAKASNEAQGHASENEKPGSNKEKSSRYAGKREEVDERANENGLTLNIYDKILSWAEFVNVRRPFDDDPDEDAGKKADSSEELSVSELSRRTANTFNAEIEKAGSFEDEGSLADDSGEEYFYYPEWDYKRQAYRPRFSRLAEAAVTGEDAGFFERVMREKAGLLREVTRSMEMLSPATRLVGRQTDGASVDLGAAIDAIADLEAGLVPDERLYSSYVKTERDLSALFLVDLSMSTDGWAGGAKIIDHEKESLVVLCEALRKLRDRYAIYGFSGKTRKGCRFYRVKGFSESYGETVRKRIGALIPYSYTRMGPAIRHATSILSREQTATRLLFILSDGKPNDVDVYEGRWGVEDTRKAIKEAEGAGITPFCLTVDTVGADYLPRIFGKGNYAVVPGVDTLAKKLPELYARIIHKL